MQQQSALSLQHVIEQVSQEKGIEAKILVEATEQAILTAAKKTFGPDRELEARFNTETGAVDLFQYMTVVEMVENIVAKMARIPAKSVSASDRKSLRTLERDLKLTIFGQDQAIDALTAAIKLARAGLREPEKPIGSYIFSGPTGVGKSTTLAALLDTVNQSSSRHVMTIEEPVEYATASPSGHTSAIRRVAMSNLTTPPATTFTPSVPAMVDTFWLNTHHRLPSPSTICSAATDTRIASASAIASFSLTRSR